jgi:hypothetical protein
VKARTLHQEDAKAGAPLTREFHRHLDSIKKSDFRNPEVQNRIRESLARDPARRWAGPDISFSGNEANPFFHNTGAGFVEIGTTLGLSRIEDSRGFVLADLDGDGALDVVLHNYFRNPIVALLNRAAGGAPWIRLRLRGTKSNRFGIGARVTVNGRVQELACGSGYQSGNAPELHFGLGGASAADVTVRWPSGRTEDYQGLAANRIHTLVEGEPAARKDELPKAVSVAVPSPPPPPPAPDPRRLLTELRTLRADPAPVKDERVLLILFTLDCQACVEELKRMSAIEASAAAAGYRVVWASVDRDARRIEEEFRMNQAPSLPLLLSPPPPGLATPTVFLLGPGSSAMYTGRHAVTAALEELR